MEIVINILHLIVSIALVAMVLLQSGRSAGISGSIGGAAETFFGKNKGRSMDTILEKYTALVAGIFLATALILTFLLK
ncbi:MAG TPA: preprotein translocase subunit SecG [Thermoclostridium sp.]|nr:preprotein translocase subunit SecG [Thermoclostridium sp.]